MPLTVLCPNGCQVRMPRNRIGKIARCPECKATIELLRPAVEEMGEANIGEGVATVRAKIASQPRLNIPSGLSPGGVREQKARHQAVLKKILAGPETVVAFKQVDVPPRPKKKRRKRKVVPPPVIQQIVVETKLADTSVEIGWEKRIEKSTADRILLSRLFGIALCIVALVNMVPAFYYWNDWYQAVEATQLPRWIYLQGFVAAVHVVYAVFLFQIPDWSAMRAVSVSMLVIAFVFGLVSTSLLIGGGQSFMASFLGLSYSIVQRAAIWCVAMLCLATLISYLGGRESANWQRTEQLLSELVG